MSGGYFDYDEYRLIRIADEIDQAIYKNNSVEKDEWGYNLGRGYTPETLAEFEKASRYLRIALIYAHRIDYLLEADDNEESFHVRLKEDLSNYEEDKNVNR